MRLAAAAAAALLFASPIEAHEYRAADGRSIDAEWIKEKHHWCCGREDCKPISSAQVTFTRHGWKVHGLKGFIQPEDVRDSEGRGPWVCDDRVQSGKDHIRCLFLPGARL